MIKRISTETLWTVLNEYRQQQGTSIEALAELSQIDASQLYRWQAHKTHPTMENVEKVCNALGLAIMVTQSPTYYENH